jgi:membrane AbrB-like protein
MGESLTAGRRRGIDRCFMRQAPASSPKLVRIAESLLIGAAGGFLFNAARFPAGWLAGSMVFAAVAALAGRPIYVPGSFARACSIALGIAIGGVVTPETLRGVTTWPLSIAMVSVSVGAATLATVTYLKRVHGWNTLTAIFASTPGGLAQVMALAAEEGRDCDIRGVAIVQTLRVVILAVVVPAALSLTGLAGTVRLPASPIAVVEAPVAFAILVGAASAVALGLLRLGFPGGLIFGPLVVSAVLHGGAFINVTLPFWLATAAMVGLGTVSGGRFTGMPFRLLLRYLGAALGAFAVSLVVTAVIGIAVTLAVPLPVSDLIVAYAPGAVDAMMILALALHLDPVFVGAHHLTRVFVVSLGLPILAHYFSAPGRRRTKSGRPMLPKGDGLDD